jgi:asparagine synthase (glutamine-hydrolysing)
VAFQGRLDEVPDLRQSLGLDSQTSVAQTLGEAYVKLGDGLANRIRGDYAVVIWDGRRQRVLAFRDPLGVRQLHYSTVAGQLVIAGDADQFLAAGAARPEPDDTTVTEFLTRDFHSLERSFFRDVARVPPGHLLVAAEGATRTSDYRTLPTTELSFSDRQEAHEAFREKFLVAVGRRLRRDVPAVIQLSGGVDSTSLVCAADALLKSKVVLPPVTAVSATFPGLDCDESPYLDVVERHVGLPLVRWNGRAATGAEFTEPLLAAPGTRIPWASGTDGYVGIARARSASTLLDGTGGDQVGIPLGTETEELGYRDLGWVVRRTLQEDLSPVKAARILKWAVGAGSPRFAREAYRVARRHFAPPVPPDWLCVTRSRGHDLQDFAPAGRRFLSSGQRRRWETLSGARLTASIDAKQRHASWFGLEIGFPFLDWDLVQFTLALPSRYWRPRGWLARIHREALRRDLPAEIYARRSKAEFSSAMINRVRAGLAIISDLFEGGAWASTNYVDRAKARRLLADFKGASSPTFAAAYHLWAIASVEAWLRRVLGYRTATA